MQRAKRVFLSTGALAVLSAVVAFGKPSNVDAAGGATQPLQVVVTNTQLPVAGTVSVDALPAVDLAPGSSVDIGNLVHVRTVDMAAPARPVHVSGNVEGIGSGPPVQYTVPAGCRFVLEQVSGHYTVASGGPYSLLVLENSTSKDELEVREDPHVDNYYRFHQSTRLYFDAGDDVGVLVLVTGEGNANGSVYLSGYLTPMPGEVCDP